MSSTPALPSSVSAVSLSVNERHALHSIQLTLKIAFILVPIIAGADKFFDLLTHWEDYLNPLVLRVIPVTAHAFMCAAGVIEIIAGLLVLAAPRFGAFVVMAWLIAIALQLVLMGQFLDVAVRDLVIALGALTLARLSPLVEPAGYSRL